MSDKNPDTPSAANTADHDGDTDSTTTTSATTTASATSGSSTDTDSTTASPHADADSTAVDPNTDAVVSDTDTVVSDADTTATAVGSGADSSSTTTESEARATDAVDSPAPAGMSSRLRRLRPPPLGRAGRIALRAAGAVVLGAAVAGSGYFYVQNEDKQDLLTAQEQARQAACGYGPVLSTYDAKNLDHYVQGVLAGATGDWRKQFETTSRDLGDVLVKGEVVAKTDDVQCAIRSADETSAEALVVMGQTITSLGTKGQPEKGQLSVVMRLEKDGDRWLVNKIDTPLAPPRP
ncbi:hypothetical protein [Nocardia wallacei]|uniref:Mce associated membrane protein n=1 Tax=Nocardia wallacei TaxID=480035 RepID=A0A7G1KTZ2_9NOCA|nr:hypothetical protein [Nocardia wallacei]BCK58677.1 hypothetical protein NWFMUON74_64490 [Nocardia wallacei]